jgi:hypothetical protein
MTVTDAAGVRASRKFILTVKSRPPATRDLHCRARKR